jgi:hypothetical protein
VKSLQQSSLVCSKLNRGSVAGCGEVFLDLFVPGEATPRYTVHVLDQPCAKETGRRFAAFIVPQGRQVVLLFILPNHFNFFFKMLIKMFTDSLKILNQIN